MAIRNAEAVWEGNLKGGKGSVKLGSGAFEGAYSFSSRFEEGTGTNPEELVGAAHSGCYSMFLAALISGEGLEPDSVETTAKVKLGKDETGPLVTNIDLVTEVKCGGLSQEKFEELAQAAKEKCPISRLVSSADVSLDAKLV